MQWTTTGDRITLPYVAPEDDLQSTPATIKALAEAVVAELENLSSGPPTGSLTAYMKGPDGVPEGWLECNGDPFDMDANPKLAAILTNGLTPDLRDRAPMAAGDDDITEKASEGGTSTFTIGANHLPDHNHTAYVGFSSHTINDHHYHDVTDRDGFIPSVVGIGFGGGGTGFYARSQPAGRVLGTAQISHSVNTIPGHHNHHSTGTVTHNPHKEALSISVVPKHYGVSCYIIKGG